MPSNVTRRSFMKIAGLSALSTVGVGMPGLLGTRSLAQEAGGSLVKSNCPLCPQGCGMDLFIENGSLTQVRGMIEDPETRGMLCERGKSLPEVLGSEKRILTPLKKSGEKGGEGFVPISWGEALSTVARTVDTDYPGRRCPGNRGIPREQLNHGCLLVTASIDVCTWEP